MFAHLRDYDGPPTIRSDVCIVGAGPAGMSIARTLAAGGHRVLLIESGGLEVEPETQELCRGHSDSYPWLDSLRLRVFGGTTQHWGSESAPFEPIDFAKRDWVPHSGWPIERAALDSYYLAAHRFLGLGEYDYDATRWRKAGLDAIPFDERKVGNGIARYADPPTRCGIAYRDEFAAARNILVLLHANAVAIETNGDASVVTGIRLRSLEGKEALARARGYVLACGGIENPRLLLASNAIEKHGLGNSRGLVGRFFMEHRGGVLAMAATELPYTRFEPYINGVPVGQANVIAKAAVPETVQRETRILNSRVRFGWGGSRHEGYMAFARSAKLLLQGIWPERFDDDLGAVLGDLDGLAAGAYHKARDLQFLWLGAECEPAPNPDSRITLSEDRDAVGLPRVKLDWRLGALDKRSARISCRLVGEELARLGLARTRMDSWLLENNLSWPEPIASGHHMGTTRMGADPSQGVVDTDCRVHGMANLFVAGSSVFPTGGYSSPTLTLVTLALRLADHLKTAQLPESDSVTGAWAHHNVEVGRPHPVRVRSAGKPTATP